MYENDKLLFASGGRSNYRIPSIVVTNDGTVAAFCNDRKDSVIDHAEEVAVVCARKLPGGTWTEVETLAGVPGWSCMIGSAVYDAETDTLMCTSGRNPVARNEFGKYTAEELAAMEKEAEERAVALGIRRGPFLLESTDSGKTWTERPFIVEGRPFIRPTDGAEVSLGGSCHGSAHGIQLRHGEHAGRLLCPSRTTVGHYDTWDGLRVCSYNNSVYSDDHGKTWKASAPVQVATGEGTLIERGDGTILYNSRAYFADQKRYLATSTDGGETWGNYRTDNFLLKVKNIGCNASLLRTARAELNDSALLPEGAESVTIFINPRDTSRRNLTACISFDEGETWAHTRQIRKHLAAYSALTYNRADGHFYLLFEHGEKDPYDGGLSVAELDLEWLLSR